MAAWDKICFFCSTWVAFLSFNSFTTEKSLFEDSCALLALKVQATKPSASVEPQLKGIISDVVSQTKLNVREKSRLVLRLLASFPALNARQKADLWQNHYVKLMDEGPSGFLSKEDLEIMPGAISFTGPSPKVIVFRISDGVVLKGKKQINRKGQLSELTEVEPLTPRAVE